MAATPEASRCGGPGRPLPEPSPSTPRASGFRTLIGVYTGASAGALQRVAGVSLTVGGTNTFTFVAKAGQTYAIAVDGYGGASGSFRLRVTSWSAYAGSQSGGEAVKPAQPKDREKDRRKEKPNTKAVAALFSQTSLLR